MASLAQVKRVAKKLADDAASLKQNILSASNLLDPSFLGDGTVSSTEFAYLNSVSSTIQTQLDAKMLEPTSTPLSGTFALQMNAGDKSTACSGTTSTELGYVSGLTSSAQTQLNARLPVSGGTLTGGIAISGVSNGIACGGASLNSGNIVTTGACEAAGGFVATNGGIQVSDNITTTSGAVYTDTLRSNSGATVSLPSGQTLNTPTLSATTANATTITCSFLNSQGVTQGGGVLLRNDRSFNPNQVNGDVEIKANTISDSDTGGLEGMSRSRVFIKQRYRRNNNGYTYNENTAVFYATTANDNNGRRVHFRTRGNMQANNADLLSDDRLKFDEEDISDATATIMQLQPQKYQKYDSISEDGSRPEGNGKTEIGLIAQDVEAIPELAHAVSETAVSLDDDEVPPKTLCYTDVFCVHLKAFQEQQAVIAALEARIAALE